MTAPLDKVQDYSTAGTAGDNVPSNANSMDNIHNTTEDISKKAQGYKATMSNPNFSDSTKEAAKEKLESLGGEDAFMKNNGKGE